MHLLLAQGAPAFLNPYLNLFFARNVGEHPASLGNCGVCAPVGARKRHLRLSWECPAACHARCICNSPHLVARVSARTAGLRPSQIGLLSALAPWTPVPGGSIVGALADRWGAHRFLLLFTYLAVTFLQARLLAGCRRGGLNLICDVALACCIQLLLVQSQAGPCAWMVPKPCLVDPRRLLHFIHAMNPTPPLTPQGLMALPPLASFAPMLCLTILASTVYAPSQIIADAAVMAASTHVRGMEEGPGRVAWKSGMAWRLRAVARCFCCCASAAAHGPSAVALQGGVQCALLAALPAARRLWAAAHVGERQLDGGEGRAACKGGLLQRRFVTGVVFAALVGGLVCWRLHACAVVHGAPTYSWHSC